MNKIWRISLASPVHNKILAPLSPIVEYECWCARDLHPLCLLTKTQIAEISKKLKKRRKINLLNKLNNYSVTPPTTTPWWGICKLTTVIIHSCQKSAPILTWVKFDMRKTAWFYIILETLPTLFKKKNQKKASHAFSFQKIPKWKIIFVNKFRVSICFIKIFYLFKLSSSCVGEINFLCAIFRSFSSLCLCTFV